MPIIETRRDLAQHLQGQMLASRGTGLASEGEEEEVPGRTSLKTYLLEAHCPDASPLIGLTVLGESNGFRVRATKDADLFHLVKGEIDVWCDTSLGRFWRLHTTAPVKDADPFRDAMVGHASWLDHVWFSPAYLEAFPDAVGAEMLLFSLNHDRRPLNTTGRPADLHFGGVLAFDITAHDVVIQLPRGVCGNTVLRFLSSLRFHVNSDASDPA